MVKKLVSLLVCICLVGGGLSATPVVASSDAQVRAELVANLKGRITSQRLANGMNVVCVPAANTNQVTVGAFVLVGSSHEEPSEYGLAHILEHMVFKGTKTRKEGELERLTAHFGMQMGRDYNAFTSHDATFYYFMTDEKNWRVFGDIVADSTKNLLVKPAPLDSELHAISQELKMRKTDTNNFSFYDFFPVNHPYAHDIIGYKEQILTYTADQVMAFYEKHYVPSKTTFFVMGNVSPDDVFAYAKKMFGNFNRKGAPATSQKLPFYAGFTTVSKTVYHEQNYKVNLYAAEGLAQSHPECPSLELGLEILSRRLKQKYVDLLEYCFNANAGLMALGKVGVSLITFVPRPEHYGVDFAAVVSAEIAALQENGITEEEFSGLKQDNLHRLMSIAEQPSTLAFQLINCASSSQDLIAEYFDRQAALELVTRESIQAALRKYVSLLSLNSVTYVPLPAQYQQSWHELQSKVVAHEAELLQSRPRIDSFAGVSYSDVSRLPERVPLSLPALPEVGSFVLDNGLEVRVVSEASVPRCSCALVLKDAETIQTASSIAGKEAAARFVGDLMLHGSCQYTAKQVDDILAEKGCAVASSGAHFSVSSFKHRFDESLAFALSLLQQRAFVQEYFDRQKQQYKDMVALLKNHHSYQLSQFLKSTLYRLYPWIFSEEKIMSDMDAVSLDDVNRYLDFFVDPSRVVLVFSGDITVDQARAYAEKYFIAIRPAGTFVEVGNIERQSTTEVVDAHIDLPTSDVLLTVLRPTCHYGSGDEPVLELVAGYLDKKLFEIREKTGLFYSGNALVVRGGKYSQGAIQFSVSMTPASVDGVRSELTHLIQALGTNFVDESTFNLLKKERAQAVGKYVNTAGTLLDLVSDAVMRDQPLNYRQLFESDVMSVTYSEFCAVLKKYFNSTDWSFITTGAK